MPPKVPAEADAIFTNCFCEPSGLCPATGALGPGGALHMAVGDAQWLVRGDQLVRRTADEEQRALFAEPTRVHDLGLASDGVLFVLTDRGLFRYAGGVLSLVGPQDASSVDLRWRRGERVVAGDDEVLFTGQDGVWVYRRRSRELMPVPKTFLDDGGQELQIEAVEDLLLGRDDHALLAAVVARDDARYLLNWFGGDWTMHAGPFASAPVRFAVNSLEDFWALDGTTLTHQRAQSAAAQPLSGLDAQGGAVGLSRDGSLVMQLYARGGLYEIGDASFSRLLDTPQTWAFSVAGDDRLFGAVLTFGPDLVAREGVMQSTDDPLTKLPVVALPVRRGDRLWGLSPLSALESSFSAGGSTLVEIVKDAPQMLADEGAALVDAAAWRGCVLTADYFGRLYEVCDGATRTLATGLSTPLRHLAVQSSHLMVSGAHELAFSDDDGESWRSVSTDLAHHWGDVAFDVLGQRWALQTDSNGTSALVRIDEGGGLTTFAVEGLSERGTLAAGADGHLWLLAESAPCVFEVVEWFEGETLGRSETFGDGSYCAGRVPLVVNDARWAAATRASITAGGIEAEEPPLSRAFADSLVTDLSFDATGALHVMLASTTSNVQTGYVATQTPDGDWLERSAPVVEAGRLVVGTGDQLFAFSERDSTLAKLDAASGEWSRKPVVGLPRASDVGWSDEGALLVGDRGGLYLVDRGEVRDITPPDASRVVNAAWLAGGERGWAVTDDQIFVRNGGAWAELDDQELINCPGAFTSAVPRVDGVLYVARKCDSGSLHLRALRDGELLRTWSMNEEGWGGGTLYAAPEGKMWLRHAGALLDAELLVPVIPEAVTTAIIGAVEVKGEQAWAVAGATQLLELNAGTWSTRAELPHGGISHLAADAYGTLWLWTSRGLLTLPTQH